MLSRGGFLFDGAADPAIIVSLDLVISSQRGLSNADGWHYDSAAGSVTTCLRVVVLSAGGCQKQTVGSIQ